MRKSLRWPSCCVLIGSFVAAFIAPAAFGAAGVYRDHVEPHWFAENARFWYRNELPGNASAFVVVDAEKGDRHPAFDHSRLAAALSTALGRAVKADHLPIDQLDFDSAAGGVILTIAGKQWHLDTKSYEVTPGAEAGHPELADAKPHASIAGGAATKITFTNRTAAAVRLVWIDTAGSNQSYGTLGAGESYQQPTFAGHVWLVTDDKGKVLKAVEAAPQPMTATIDGVSAPASAAARRRNTGGRRQSRPGPESPDGQWVVVVKDSNLFLRDKKTKEELSLSHDGKPGDSYTDQIWWSADSKNLVAMRVEPAQAHSIYTVESSPNDQLQPKLRTLEYLKAGDKIAHPRPMLFHVADRQQVAVKEELFPNPWSIEDVRWSADGSRFTFVYNQRGHQVLRIVSVDAATGKARAIVDEKSPTFIDYSGKYYCRWTNDHELIWMSERDGWNHLWLIDASTGQVKNVMTPGEWVVQDVVWVDSDKRQIWFDAGGVRAGQDPYYTHFCRVDFDGTHLTVLTEGDGTHQVQWKPGDKYLIDTWSRVDQPPITELRSAESGKLLCRLEEADAGEALAAVGGRWPERFVAKGRDGSTDIYGMIHYPRDFDPAKKYPVVEQIYAGPQGFYVPKAFRPRYGGIQKLADLGMILVQIDGMGTSGRSKAFHDVCFKNLRDAGFPDRINWIKAAAKTRPQMDLARVGIYGGSAGGQNAMAALLWHNDFYKVAVADCGCHDNRMDKIWWNEQWMSWPVDSSYAANSNVNNAHLLQGKLMLIFGELDDNVDPSSTMQVVNALEKANKDFDLVVVTGAHHGAAETPYGSHRRTEFLKRHLIDEVNAPAAALPQ